MKKVAIVYDRVNKWGGAERVLLALHELYPKASLYTSVYNSKNASWAKKFPEVKTSFIQKIPFARNNHEFLALLMPLAFRSFNFKGYDLVISVTSEFAKGIKVDGTAVHICYMLTPTRYLWSGHNEYFKNKLLWLFSRPAVVVLRLIDKNFAKKPNKIIAISAAVKKRIKKYYGKNSVVVFPPVNIVKAKKSHKNDYYLLVSRLDYGYKKVDLAIKAFKQNGKKLLIVGTGRMQSKLKQMAAKNITFLGKLNETQLAATYRNAKALIMPQEEDFGIVAVEAQSHGTPIIAYAKGGALDTVIKDKTGIFFDEQSILSLNAAISRFEKMRFKEHNLVHNAQKFSKKHFKENFAKIVHKEYERN